MPRVYSQKARKDYPNEGIKRGDTYYRWNLKTGPRSGRLYRSKEYPKPEQLTQSAFYQALYPLQREQGEFDGDEGDLQGLIDQYNELAEEEQGKYDNMPEGLQMGSTGELIQERSDACREAADELERLMGEQPERGNYGDSEEGEEEFAQAKQDWIDEVRGVEANI